MRWGRVRGLGRDNYQTRPAGGKSEVVIVILDRPLRAQLAVELNSTLRGARVRRVHQPDADTLILTLRGPGGNTRLLATANPRRPRVHTTRQKPANPRTPPPFCMLARKHLVGRPFALAWAEEDRPVIHLRFGPRSKEGGKSAVVLTTEMTGHAATVLLLDEENGSPRILGLIRPLPAAPRRLGSRDLYELPALTGRLDPERTDPAAVVKTVNRLRAAKKGGPGERADRLLSRVFEGVGRLLAAHVIDRAGWVAGGDMNLQTAAAILKSMKDALRTPCRPALLTDDEGQPADLLPFAIAGSEHRTQSVPSISEALDILCTAREEREGLEGMRLRTLRSLSRLIAHRELKLGRQREDLARAAGGELWRRQAHLLLAEGDTRRRRLSAIDVVDAFDPAAPSISIPLDPALTLAENAERLYAKAKKAKRGVTHLRQIIDQGEVELRYLEEQQLHAEMAGDTATLATIDESHGRNVKRAPTRRKSAHRPARAPAPGEEEGPRRFDLAGWEVLVGRHGRDNDRIVTRIGSAKDLWFHARGIPGAHVLLRRRGGREAPSSAVEGAARLAAHFSRAREDRSVDVIVAELSQVRKPRGLPPGQVLVRKSRTLRVAPGFPEGLISVSRSGRTPA